MYSYHDALPDHQLGRSRSSQMLYIHLYPVSDATCFSVTLVLNMRAYAKERLFCFASCGARLLHSYLLAYQLSELAINTLCACVMKSKVSVWKSIALVATLIGLCLLFRQDSGPTGLIR